MTVAEILEEVLEREGWPAYAVHPNDRGGPTKGGITLRTLESWRGRRCTRAELQRLPKDEALAILKRRYVDANGINRVVNETLRAQVIDNAVLSGPMLAVQDLQRSLETVEVDGIIGPKTLAAVDAVGSHAVGLRLAVARSIRLCRHVVKNPDQAVFLVGWMKRCLSFVTPPI
jgi:lysozyme family protein|tara:strand:- start:359 stop:877 length:519 start_codon:yes stop_codon:yes gene_type:complete